MLNILGLFENVFQKLVHIEENLMKLNICLFEDDELLENYNEYGKKSEIPSKNFNSEPVDNKKYLKTKIKSYDGKISTNFHNNKIPKKVLNAFFISNFSRFCF